jgi:hypothetical protein
LARVNSRCRYASGEIGAGASIAIAPALRGRADDDEIEPFPIGILAGSRFTFDAEWLELASHDVLLKPRSPKTVLRTREKKRRTTRGFWRTIAEG